MTSLPEHQARALDVFRQHGGMLRVAAARRAGVNSATLYALRDAGLVEPVARGLYRLSGLEDLGNPDLTIVGAKAPEAVVCLISALAFHELTTEIPHQVYIALRQGSHCPKIAWPPVRAVYMGEPCFSAGIGVHELDGVSVRIYSAEKTIVDCFKYRNKIGMDIALEALRSYRERGRIQVAGIAQHAQTCRVWRVIRPYLEAGLT
jgi:predicted transcriptional regulator of viral defense system